MGLLSLFGVILLILAVCSWLGFIHLAVAAVPVAIVGVILLVVGGYFGGWFGPHRRL